MINWARTGTAALVGAGSAAVTKWMPNPLVLGTTSLSWAAIAEASAFAGGMLLDMWNPQSRNLNDGLMDGGAALVSKRLAERALTQVAAQPFYPLRAGAYGPQMAGVAPAIRVGPAYNPMPAYGAVGKERTPILR